MRDNVKGGALTEVTFYILLSLFSPKHGYAIMQFIEEKAGRHGGGVIMKYKAESLKSAVAPVAVVVAAILATNFFGIGTKRSAVRIGFVNRGGWRSWSESCYQSGS